MGGHKGMLWQFFSYPFVQSPIFSFSLLLALAFHLLILFYVGSAIVDRYGYPTFFNLFFGSAIFSGCIAWGIMALGKYSQILAGPSPIILALLTFWTRTNPHAEFYLFFLMRIKAKWIVAILIGLSLLSALLSGQFILLLSDLAGVLYGFLVSFFTHNKIHLLRKIKK